MPTTREKKAPALPSPRAAALQLAVGVVVAVGSFAFVVTVSNDMRWLLAVGGGAVLAASFAFGRTGRSAVAPGLVWLPLAGVYGLVVLPQLPGLWPHLVLWAAAAGCGWWMARRPSLVSRSAVLAVVALSLGYAQLWVPERISESLTTLHDREAPPLSLQRLNGDPLDTSDLDGRILVLDFFATWCLPCVAELPELEGLRADLADRDDIVVLVVANDSGGDTPESIAEFVERSGTTLPFVYDRGGVTHRAFGFSGLPGLAVVDSAGRLRMTREGYNAAERDFRADLARLLERL